jgi:hypothetical protein
MKYNYTENEKISVSINISTLLFVAIVLAALILSSGCASLPSTDEGAAGVVKHYKPEYAGAIDQITDLLVGKRINPVEGFTRVERWQYRGDEINPNDLSLSVAYERAFAVSGAMMSPVSKPEGEVSDAELKAEIEAILKASGVAE